jgi:GAF domain-containing protein
MHAFAQGARDAPHHLLLLERALEGAMSLLGTDLGNVQVRQPATGELRIAAQSVFDRAFLEHFALVSDSSTACGPAAARGSPTVIADVDTDPGFAPHRDVAAASGFRAVQSTPLVDHSGRVRGVISTHFRRSRQPNVEDLRVMGWYGELIGCAFAAQQRTPTLV